MEYQCQIQDVPGKGLGLGNFHKHLELTDLRADANFPAFEDLPGDNDINMEFYSSIDGFYYTPRKHWCFLAEVIEVTFFLRLTVLVRDKAGKTVSVWFYTDEKGNELAMSGLRTGQTIAILYAEQHGFLDMSVGIRLEEIHAIKILPVSLDELFKLNDRIQLFSKEEGGQRRCHGCGNKVHSPRKCAKCSLFWYCNEECQQIGWKSNSHKGDCKVLRDSDVQMIYHLDWETFKDYFRFPLENAK